MRLLALAALLAFGSAHAATQVLSCYPGNVPPLKVTLPSNTLSSNISPNATGSPSLCVVPANYPGSYFIKVTLNGGSTWSWVTLASLGLGQSAAAPSDTVSWQAVTNYTSGAVIGIPVTYNVYRGTSAAALVSIASTSLLAFKDTAVAAGVTYYYAVTATCNGCVESLKSAVVAITIGQPPALNQPGAPAKVTAI